MAIINPLPTTIANGQAVDANPVMQLFNWILSQVNANAQPLGATQLPEFAYERENTLVLGNLNASQGIDWSAQGYVTVTVTGASATFTYSNLPPGGNGGMSQTLAFKVTNGGLATSLFGTAKKPSGFALSNAATDWVCLACIDGTTPEVIGLTKAVS